MNRRKDAPRRPGSISFNREAFAIGVNDALTLASLRRFLARLVAGLKR